MKCLSNIKSTHIVCTQILTKCLGVLFWRQKLDKKQKMVQTRKILSLAFFKYKFKKNWRQKKLFS